MKNNLYCIIQVAYNEYTWFFCPIYWKEYQIKTNPKTVRASEAFSLGFTINASAAESGSASAKASISRRPSALASWMLSGPWFRGHNTTASLKDKSCKIPNFMVTLLLVTLVGMAAGVAINLWSRRTNSIFSNVIRSCFGRLFILEGKVCNIWDAAHGSCSWYCCKYCFSTGLEMFKTRFLMFPSGIESFQRLQKSKHVNGQRRVSLLTRVTKA